MELPCYIICKGSLYFLCFCIIHIFNTASLVFKMPTCDILQVRLLVCYFGLVCFGLVWLAGCWLAGWFHFFVFIVKLLVETVPIEQNNTKLNKRLVTCLICNYRPRLL